MNRVVVTGLGTVTPLGRDPEQVFARLVNGDIAVDAPGKAGHRKAPTQAIGEVPQSLVGNLERSYPEVAFLGDRRTLFGYVAGCDALRSSGLDAGEHFDAGLFMGSGPGVQRLEDVGRLGADIRATHAGSLLRHSVERPAHLVASAWGIRGPVHAITTACSASNQALGCAYRAVASGELTWAVAGGADSMIHPLGLVFFVLLGAAAQVDPSNPSAAGRPFDRKRTGLVMGEGAGCVVLEREDHARARSATIHAEVTGYGSSLDAHRTTAPPRDGRGAAVAMAAALGNGVRATDVDFVNAHGTGTKRNDPAEVRAIYTVFGDHARNLAVVSSKGAMGHLLSAAAGVAFVCSVLTIRQGRVPPTANCEQPDTLCDLDFVPEGREKSVFAALNNSFAFGGQNACMALKQYAPPPEEAN